MKYLTWILAIIAVIYFLIMKKNDNQHFLIIVKMQNENAIPRYFRTTKDSYLFKESPFPSRQGLDRLNIVGSSQFSEASLKFILHYLNKPKSLILIDLRQEPHGFINGAAVTWFVPGNLKNQGKSLAQIEKEEQELLQAVFKEKQVVLHQIVKKDPTEKNFPLTTSYPVTVTSVKSEKELAKELGISYLRIPSTDHLRPTDEAIDTFVNFVRNLPEETWLMIHCLGGAGRTTTFMTMYDMMKNAKDVSYDDIVRRQRALGGVNLEVISPNPYKQAWSLQKIEVLKDFYQYCRQNQDNFEQSWFDYLAQKDQR
jgi:predicted protein tyrosine phosphatase